MTDRSLRIAIACYPTYGGSGILATELGVALAERGHDVHFLAYAEPPRLHGTSRVHVHLVEVSAYPLFKYPPYDLALASKMRELLVDGIDVLHVHYAIPHALCAYLARQMAPEAATKVVTTLHGTDITVIGSDPAYREVTCFGLRHSDRVIAVSEFLRDETYRLFQTDRKIDVVPNFVDTRRFRPADTPESRPLHVVHMSNFRKVKRPLDVIQAFALIVQKVDARLLLVGDGPELPSCMELADKLDVTDRVERLGSVANVEDVLKRSDLLLQPSGSEAFGLAALEAMSCGVPVVGYRVGGLPEVVESGVTGVLVPFCDVKTLAAHSIDLLSDPVRRSTYSTAARERAVRNFSVEKSVTRHEEIYFDVLNA